MRGCLNVKSAALQKKRPAVIAGLITRRRFATRSLKKYAGQLESAPLNIVNLINFDRLTSL